MRHLHEQFKNNHVETIDGVKIHSPNGSWVHISPHPDRPTFEVVTEANSKQVAEEMVQQAIQQVERLRDAG